MSNIKTSLDDIFDVPSTVTTLDDIPLEMPQVIGQPIQSQKMDIEVYNSNYVSLPEDQEQQDDDFRKVRRNLREITDKGNKLLDGIMDVAKDTDKPSAYEAASVLIKTLADVNKDLLDIHEKNKKFRQKENDQPGASGDVNIDKAIFVGTPADLLKKLNEKDDDK